MKHNPFLLAAKQFKDVNFFKYGFPVIALVGGGVFLFFGFKGIFTKSTITLGKGWESQFRPNEIRGWAAQLVGVLYVILGVVLGGGLGLLSYYIHAA